MLKLLTASLFCLVVVAGWRRRRWWGGAAAAAAAASAAAVGTGAKTRRSAWAGSASC